MTYYRSTKFIDDSDVVQGFKHIQNKIRVSSMPYFVDITEGNVANHAALRKFGHNPDVGAVEEDVWDGGGVYTGWITAAETVDIVSDDANDDAGGTGALTVQIYGLDASFAEQNETLTMDGVTPVTSSGTYIRIFRAVVRTAGSQGENDGTITVDGTTSGAVLAKILPLMNQTLMALWTVPASKTAYLTHFYAATSSNKATEVLLRVRPENEVFHVNKLVTINQGTTILPYDFPLPITAKSDISVSASAVGGGGDVSGGFDLWYET